MRSTLKKIALLYGGNSFFRAKLQERKAAIELTYYRRQAVQNGIASLKDKALIFTLKKRLNDRGIFSIPKQKGDLHIFLAYYISNWEAVLPKVLKSFGKVTEFEWRSRGFDEHAPNWLGCRELMNKAMLNAFYEAQKEQPVDVVVGYLSGNNTNPEILKKMGKAAVIFNFCWDDKLSFRGKKIGNRWCGPAALASAVDLNLTNAPGCRIKYMVEGGLAMFWPEAAHPDVHKLYDLPFEYDVSFIGGKYGWRPMFISKLQKLGVNITCFGNGWKNGPLSDEEMVRLYSISRINLGFAGVVHSKRLMCLKGRDFEVPMSGGLYLTQHNPELFLIYDVGKEIMTYKDEKDCAEKIKRLLLQPDEADRIREAGRKRALLDHTWERRFEEIFRLAGIME